MLIKTLSDWLMLPPVLYDYHLNLDRKSKNLLYTSSRDEHADSPKQDASMAVNVEHFTDTADVDTLATSLPPDARPRQSLMQLHTLDSESESPLPEPTSMDSLSAA